LVLPCGVATWQVGVGCLCHDLCEEGDLNNARGNIQPTDKRRAGISTGFAELDEVIGGLKPSELIVVAGEQSECTAFFASSIAAKIGIVDSLPVAIFSFNIKREAMAMQILSAASFVPMYKLRNGFLSSEDWPLLARAGGQLAEAPIFIEDSITRTVEEMRGKILNLTVQRGPALVVVDNLHLVRGRDNSEKDLGIAGILHALKSMAEEIQSPVMVLSRNSGLNATQMDGWEADVVLNLFREEIRQDESDKPDASTKVVVLKGRCETPRTVELAFDKGRHEMTFSSRGSMTQSSALTDSIKACFRQIERWYEHPGEYLKIN
jgi:replicative DNA helicase